ncbi:hypothetical protein [Hymenobacter terricola]|uniref:hypothetical protein n=1 Tax=Hymenobacter terricola TaxID=2819236 RepID=UPI001B308406|nr:hypothetical protein [Hymenobacter terricola]
MLPEDIDDLFRDKLAGHETPPGDALWARLQAAPEAEPAADANAERLDQLFRQGLHAHATPPRRELWERLEDEHLRPHKRRPAAWWPMAVAAALALLLVAGGAGLWLGFPSASTPAGTVASQQHQRTNATANAGTTDAAAPAATKAATAAVATDEAPTTATVATNTLAQPSKKAYPVIIKENEVAQATRPTALASTTPKARMAAPGQSPRHPLGTNRELDAAAGNSPLVAHTTAPSAAHPAPTLPTAPDEQRPSTPTTSAVVATATPVPAPEIVPARPIPAPSVANAGELITVDVRSGAAPAARPTKIFSAATAPAPDERRGLGGRLLQQAGHLVRGERVSLAEATGLPENVTLRATVAGRSLTKSIQL